ncbi:hypothetical protein AB0D14_42135 [Streptomyces sp. NPDC048484]|uniref:hypothetical protein n=1 Tax=Streptomyces sp. NPDC048484 TaxID=3155146 RepID=UPI0034361899
MRSTDPQIYIWATVVPPVGVRTMRDVAIGDDGGRNDEPGFETEAPEVDGALAMYPGRPRSGGMPGPRGPRTSTTTARTN